MNIRAGFLALAVLALPAAVRAEETSLNVGFTVLDWTYRGVDGERTVRVAVWYPTSAEPKEHAYGGPTRGLVAVDAAPLAPGGPWPLLVFSHGYGGGGFASVFFTEALAARGWIVAAPDHNDRHSAVRIGKGQVEDFDRVGLLRHAKEISGYGPEDRDKLMYRVEELQLVLDRMLGSEKFAEAIDPRRIAVGGHSLGGFTALGLCGAVKGRRDARVRAVLIFSSGAAGYLYREEELAAVRMPAMVFLGEAEKEDKRGDATMAGIAKKVYGALSAPKYLREVRGATHFSFNNRFSDTDAARKLSGTDAQFATIRRHAIAFLEKHVAGKAAAGSDLDAADAGLTRQESDPAAGAGAPRALKTDEPVRIPADPAKGFHWDYFLLVPATADRKGSTLLVVPNNTGKADDDIKTHEDAALLSFDHARPIASKLNLPVLIPVFPRPMSNWQIYTHALDRDVMTTGILELKRLDLQLLAMIEDAKGRMAGGGFKVADRILMMGFSASGMFVNRFALLHPEAVRAAAIGSPGGLPMVPVATLAGQPLRYPIGTADLAGISGARPDLEELRKLKLYFFLGADDDNDSVIYRDGFEKEDEDLVMKIFGGPLKDRWAVCRKVYADEKFGNVEFVLYPRAGHRVTEEMTEGILTFFRSALAR